MWLKIGFLLFLSHICIGQQLLPNQLSLSVNKVKPPYHHQYYDPYHHQLIYGGGILSYLTFLAVKIKIIFVIGAIFTFFLFAGKLYALIKFGEHMLEKKHHHQEHESEKIYVPSHHHHGSHDYSGFSGPIISPSFDIPPSMYASDKRYRRPHSRLGDGGRSFNIKNDNKNRDGSLFYKIYDKLRKLIRRVNITGIILNKMGIKNKDCRKKFICELDVFSKENIILKTGLHVLRDRKYINYQPKINVTKLEECKNLYTKCKETK